MLEGGVWGGLEVCERVCERAARAGRYASRTPSPSAFIYPARFFPSVASKKPLTHLSIAFFRLPPCLANSQGALREALQSLSGSVSTDTLRAHMAILRSLASAGGAASSVPSTAQGIKALYDGAMKELPAAASSSAATVNVAASQPSDSDCTVF